MAMVNMNSLLGGKDSRWLQLEVCREFQRNKCSRPDTECKFAHPPANVEVQNGRVTACYDSIKGRCNREKPPCKYFHPPQHLKDQLLINGRNHLALKNALLQQMGLTPGQPMVPGQMPTVASAPYLTGMPQVGSTFSPYFSPGPLMPAMLPATADPNNPLTLVPSNAVAQQKITRTDRIETPAGIGMTAPLGCITTPQQNVTNDTTVVSATNIFMASRKRPLDPSPSNSSPEDLLMMDMKGVGSFYYDNFAFPGMMPFKRAAGDKSGVPVYQPNAATAAAYQQLLQPFVPVSCEYSIRPTTTTNTLAGVTGANINKQSNPLSFLVRPNVPTSTTSPPMHQTPPPHFTQAVLNPSLTHQLSNSIPTSVASFQHMMNGVHPQQQYQNPFLTDLIAATQLSRLQQAAAAQNMVNNAMTGVPQVPAAPIYNNNNNEDMMLQPYKKIKRDA